MVEEKQIKFCVTDENASFISLAYGFPVRIWLCKRMVEIWDFLGNPESFLMESYHSLGFGLDFGCSNLR